MNAYWPSSKLTIPSEVDETIRNSDVTLVPETRSDNLCCNRPRRNVPLPQFTRGRGQIDFALINGNGAIPEAWSNQFEGRVKHKALSQLGFILKAACVT